MLVPKDDSRQTSHRLQQDSEGVNYGNLYELMTMRNRGGNQEGPVRLPISGLFNECYLNRDQSQEHVSGRFEIGSQVDLILIDKVLQRRPFH
jgi:hypothetical protein